MGRTGLLRTRWSALPRRRRLGMCAAAVLAAGLIGATVQTGSDAGTPAPVVWRDHVVDATTSATTR